MTVAQLLGLLGHNWRSPENIRRNVARIKRSIGAKGLRKDYRILIDRRTGKVCDGYCLIKALAELGYTRTVTLQVEYL